MSGNGNIYFERAIGPNKIGDGFSKEMGIVLGENLDYNSEIVVDYGFQASVFIAYDLLNTNYEEAYNNLTICPAMRNAHIYGADSVWEYSKRMDVVGLIHQHSLKYKLSILYYFQKIVELCRVF